MADVKPGNRPLSPHLTIYRMPLNGIVSIMHRITGAAMAAGAVLMVWWFLAAASSEAAFARADGIMTSWLGGLIMIGFLWALWFHFCNGIRHLFWDVGLGFDPALVEKSAAASAALSVVLTILTLIVM